MYFKDGIDEFQMYQLTDKSDMQNQAYTSPAVDFYL